MTKLTLALAILGWALTGCSSISFAHYQPNVETTDALSRVKDGYNAGTVSGQTLVESDSLVKSSLPCRTRVIKTPDGEPMTIFISNALATELRTAGKVNAVPNRRVDIKVVKLESDTSKIHNGEWSLDFIYKIGSVSRDVQTTTSYAFSADAAEACQTTADSLNDALRENFKKFFATLR